MLSIYKSIKKHGTYGKVNKVTENMKNVSYNKQRYRSNSGPPEYASITLATHHVSSNEVIGYK